MILNILTLPILFLIGIATSYEDFRHGKIANRWIVFGIVWSFFVVLFLLAVNFLGLAEIISLQYAGKVAMNFSAVIVVSFLMWKFGAWAAGDAKLFITFSVLLPLTFYWKSYLPIFPSFALLVNIFALIFLYMLVRASVFYGEKILMSFRTLAKKPKNISEKIGMTKIVNWKSFALFFQKRINTIIAITGIFLAVAMAEKILLRYFLIEIDLKIILPIVFAVLILFNEMLKRFTEKMAFLKTAGVVILVTLFGYSLIFDFSSAIKIIWQSILIMVAFMLVFKLFETMSNFYMRETSFQKNIPFAFWMFMGVILTLFFKSSVINVVIKLIN